MHELRIDPVTGRRVVIADNRDHRPNEFRRPSEVVARGGTRCPFCADTMRTPPALARYGSSPEAPWQVCVVPNLYPVLTLATGEGARSTPSEPWQSASPRGMHEVVIESPTHKTALSELSGQQLVWMLTAYRDRMRAMLAEKDVVFAMPLKNMGPDAGASIEHSHSQIVGLPFVPPVLEEELAGALRFQRTQADCVFCGMLRSETALEQRVVAASERYVAWCPYASRFGYETWIAPRRHGARFEEESDGSLADLARVLHDVTQRMEAHPRVHDLNYFFHSAPRSVEADAYYHWHIEVIPRIAKVAGVEWGAGLHINTVAPEKAASELVLCQSKN